MKDFDTSKGEQDILVSHATRDLLIAILNAELSVRSNLIPLNDLQRYEVDGEVVELLDNAHMLGSCQVRVTMNDGWRVGYSSDFFWPMRDVLEVDELVVDATYGSPDTIRHYQQQEVEDRLVEIVAERSRNGPVAILGFRGRLHYGMALFSGILKCPFLVTPRVASVAEVYKAHGFGLQPWITVGSAEARSIVDANERYIVFVEPTERRHQPWLHHLPKILLSAFMVPKEEPILDYGNGDVRIALTDHADFEGTIEYVRASAAKRVVTHPQSAHAQSLAREIRSRLNIASTVAEEISSYGWG